MAQPSIVAMEGIAPTVHLRSGSVYHMLPVDSRICQHGIQSLSSDDWIFFSLIHHFPPGSLGFHETKCRFPVNLFPVLLLMILLFHAFKQIRSRRRKVFFCKFKTAAFAFQRNFIIDTANHTLFFPASRTVKSTHSTFNPRISTVWRQRRGGAGFIKEITDPFRRPELEFPGKSPQFDPRPATALELLLFAAEFVDEVNLLVLVPDAEFLSRPAGMIVELKVSAPLDRLPDRFGNVRAFGSLPVNRGNDFQTGRCVFRTPVRCAAADKQRKCNINSCRVPDKHGVHTPF